MKIHFTTAVYIRKQRLWVIYDHLWDPPKVMYYTPTYPKNLEELKALLLISGQKEVSTLKKLPQTAKTSADILEDTMTLLSLEGVSTAPRESAHLLLYAGTNEAKASAYSNRVAKHVHFESNEAAHWILNNPTVIDL